MNSTHLGVGFGSLFSAVSIANVLAYFQGPAAPVNDEAAIIMGVILGISYAVMAFLGKTGPAATAPSLAPQPEGIVHA